MNEELEIRNEELGINAVAPLGRVLLCASLPRAELTADGFLPFQDAGWVRSVERGNVRGLGYLCIENDYIKSGRIENSTGQV